MATILSANLETSASSLLQRSFLCPCEPTPSCLAVVPSWRSKSLGVLRNDGHSKFANDRSRGFCVSTRATVTASRDVDSVRIGPVSFLTGTIFEIGLANWFCSSIPSLDSFLNI